ncbi:hypothetical protein H0R92_09775 [Treponema sp. OMZ 840]|uniref:hypothetical protein n=1 Tax=Treponema sp. OMZ 840 TaxID=244313 RepID=UPI003D8CC369
MHFADALGHTRKRLSGSFADRYRASLVQIFLRALSTLRHLLHLISKRIPRFFFCIPPWRATKAIYPQVSLAKLEAKNRTGRTIFSNGTRKVELISAQDGRFPKLLHFDVYNKTVVGFGE